MDVEDPQWHQWLRGVRQSPPSVEELVSERDRVREVRRRAGEIDDRWRRRRERIEGEGEGEGMVGRRSLVGGVGVVGERLRAEANAGAGHRAVEAQVVRGGQLEEKGSSWSLSAGGGRPTSPHVESQSGQQQPQPHTQPEEDPWERKKREVEQEEAEEGEIGMGAWVPKVGKR